MGVIRTDQMLLDDPSKLFNQLRPLFNDATVLEIKNYLMQFGMILPDDNDLKQIVTSLQRKKVWQAFQEQFLALQKRWDGPNIPIYIFPSNIHNENLNEQFSGLSGLAFKDKLFIFISNDNDLTEVNALLTHEYHHVVRLNQYDKREEDYTLLDTMILEGLANYVVAEQFGEKYVSRAITNYDDEALEKMYETYIRKNLNLRKNEFLHDILLYGLEKSLPNMVGYAVGYYLVKCFINEHQVDSDSLLTVESEIIAQIN